MNTKGKELARLRNKAHKKLVDSIGVGIKMGGAPAVISSRLILDLMDEVYTPKN